MGSQPGQRYWRMCTAYTQGACIFCTQVTAACLRIILQARKMLLECFTQLCKQLKYSNRGFLLKFRKKGSKQLRLILPLSVLLCTCLAGCLHVCPGQWQPPAGEQSRAGNASLKEQLRSVGSCCLCGFSSKKGSLLKDLLAHCPGPKLPHKRLLGLLQQIPGV